MKKWLKILDVRGWTKIFRLLPPTDMPYLYRTMYPVGEYTSDFSIKMHDYSVPWIPVDPDHPDLEKYPLFEHASPVTVRVEKGDTLYLPSLWFHKVMQESDEDRPCIAVNFWYDMKFDARYTWTVFQDRINSIIHNTLIY